MKALFIFFWYVRVHFCVYVIQFIVVTDKNMLMLFFFFIPLILYNRLHASSFNYHNKNFGAKFQSFILRIINLDLFLFEYAPNKIKYRRSKKDNSHSKALINLGHGTEGWKDESQLDSSGIGKFHFADLLSLDVSLHTGHKTNKRLERSTTSTETNRNCQLQRWHSRSQMERRISLG